MSRLIGHAAALALAATAILPSTDSPVLARTAEVEPKRAAKAPAATDAIVGEWWTEGREGRIRFQRHKDGTYVGITTCCKPDEPTEDNPGIDKNNPDPKLRTRSTVGIVLIWGLGYAEDGKYTDGYVYNPRDGHTYRFQATVINRTTLKIRGYVGIPLLGETQTWRRF